MELALDIICYILSTLLGLAVGSFLNVCIYRLPRGKFFENSRSYCPKCGAPIKAYDNIPILSYIILGGRCRACKERISPRYPIIEALNMVLWIVNYAVFGMNYITIVYDILVSTMIVVAMVDYDTTEIPDSAIITIILLGLITFIPVFGMSWQSKLIGAFCISVPMLIIALFGGMGLGDVKLYFALGLLLGWEKMIIVFMASFVLGAIGGITNMLIIRRRRERGVEMSHGARLGAYDGNGTIEPQESLTATAGEEAVNEDRPISLTVSRAVSVSDEESESTEPVDALDAERVLDDRTAANRGIGRAIANGEGETLGEPSHDGIVEIEGLDSDTIDSEVDEQKDSDTDDEYEKKLEENLSTGRALPFGPFIVIAGIVVMYFGDMIVNFYKSLLGI